jgi:CheY-like chemotaxis protein
LQTCPVRRNDCTGGGVAGRIRIVNKGKILVMDDEEMARDVVREMLRHIKYEAEVARDGAEAIELYKRAKETDKPFDAVIMDLIVVGGMGGEEAISKLLEIDPEVKAIVSSGNFNDPIMADCKKYGFSAVLRKPCKIAELDKTLHKVIMGIEG